MQVRKLSLHNFLARRRTTVQRLLAAENITTSQQLVAWCDARGLESPESSTLNSLFPPKETPKVQPVQPRPQPLIHTPPPPQPQPPPPSLVDTVIPAVVENDHGDDGGQKKSRPRKPRFDDEKIEDSE